MAFGFELDQEREGAAESIRQFCMKALPLLHIGEKDKRTIENGVKILKAYFKHYENDGLHVMKDANGELLIERSLNFPMLSLDNCDVHYFGTVDAILEHQESKMVYIADHKTTSALGEEFYNRIKPNHQYTGYVMAAQKVLGINTNKFMVNGIQVAKTKSEFARQVTERNEEDFKELELAVKNAVATYLVSYEDHQWPMHAPNPCSNYGGCQYLNVCNSPESIRENIIKSKWETR